MPGGNERDLIITLRFIADAADQAEQQYHARSRARMRQTSDIERKLTGDNAKAAAAAHNKSLKEQAAADKKLAKEKAKDAKDSKQAIKDEEDAYVRAILKKLRAEKQLANQKAKDAKEAKQAIKDEEDAYVRAVLKKLRAEKKLADEKAKANREIASAELKSQKNFDALWEKATKDSVRAVAKITDDFHQEQADKAREAANAKEYVENQIAEDSVRNKRMRIKEHADREAAADKERAATKAKVAQDADDAAAAKSQAKVRSQYADKLSLARDHAQDLATMSRESADKSLEYSKQAMEASSKISTAKTKEEKAEWIKRTQAALKAAKDHGALSRKQADESAYYARQATAAAKKATTDNYEFSAQGYKGIAREAKRAADSARRDFETANDGIKQSSRDATKEVSKGMRDIGEATDGATKKTMGFGAAFMTLHYTEKVVSGLRDAWMALAQSAAEAQKHIEGIVEKMEEARDKYAEILAMRGEKPTGAAVANFSKEAQAASVETGEYAKFSEELESGIQSYVQPKELNISKEDMGMMEQVAPFEAAELKQKQSLYPVTDQQKKSMAKKAVTYAVALGIDPKAAAGLLQTIIRTSPRDKDGKVNEQQVMEDYTKVIGTMEQNPGKAAQLIDQFNEVAIETMNGGGDVKDIKKVAIQFSAAAVINPKKASTFARAIPRGLRQILSNKKVDKETGLTKKEELGINDKMSTDDQLLQIAKRIPEIAKEKGISEDSAINEYFNEIKEFAGFRSFLNQGIRGGMFKRIKDAQDKITDKDREKVDKEFRADHRGIKKAQLAEGDSIDHAMATKFDNLMIFRRNAVNQIKASDELQEGESLAPAMVTATGQQFGRGNRAEQLARRQEGYNLVTKLENYKEGRAFLAGEGAELKSDHGNMNDKLRGRAANLYFQLKQTAESRHAAGKKTSEAPTAGEIQEAAMRAAFAGATDTERKTNLAGFATYEDFQENAGKSHREFLGRKANQLLAGQGAKIPTDTRITDRPNTVGTTSLVDLLKIGYNQLTGGVFKGSRMDAGEPSRTGVTRNMTQADIGANLSTQLANAGAEQVVRNLNAAAANLNQATKPRVPTAVPGGTPFVQQN